MHCVPQRQEDSIKWVCIKQGGRKNFRKNRTMASFSIFVLGSAPADCFGKDSAQSER